MASCQVNSCIFDEASSFAIGILNSMSCCFDAIQSIYYQFHQNANETKHASADPNFGLQK